MIKKEQKIKIDRAGRLDMVLSGILNSSRSQVQKIIDNNLVLINDKLPKKAGDRVKEGDIAKILEKKDLPINRSGNLEKDKIKRFEDHRINIEVIFETQDYLIISKPARLLIHPTEANEPNTLVDWILKNYPAIKKVGDSLERPGIVHRLDREVSGLLVIAKNQKMFAHLKKQFQARTVDKEYYVLVHGKVAKDFDQIDFEIDRGTDGKMVSRPKIDKTKLANVDKIQEGKEASTEFVVEKRFARFTLLKVKIHTGRTNQIRVHMLAYNHPVVGDVLYFNKKLNRKRDLALGRVFLHAYKLCFDDLSGERKCFEVGLLEELNEFLKTLN